MSVLPNGHALGALLAGGTAVVTGGANGMGARIVQRLAEAGVHRGVSLDLPEALNRTQLPDGWREIAVDLRDDASVTAAFAKARDFLSTINILVAAAGIVPLWTGICDLDPREWDAVLGVNARGVARSIQETVPAMSGGGAIVVIASQNAWRGNPNLASYVASKHAVVGLVRSVALELGPKGIRVNAIAPGSVATDAYVGRLKRREQENGLTVEEALERDGKTTPLQRLATADEIASGVLFLASELASGVAGHLLPIGASA
jgi:NAD(P)-dependent dehydrogenase (short-subunit alcohol dehydrogenase family)